MSVVKYRKPNEVPSVLKAVRKHCIGCNNTAKEVSRCQIESCWLWPYRDGKTPIRVRKHVTKV